MGMSFTPEQQKVIDLRGCNILVSAAAGSGKTAVLTERIVSMVSDEEHPVDIDRILALTFTNAAAAEMRERIGNKLSDRLAEHPESAHLQRQLTLLHAAQITTIDSFCLFLLKNHFQEIGLDPAFRVMDEREQKLLEQEALSEILEEAFAEARPDFLECVECFCPSGREKNLEEHILGLSDYAASFPWPEEWLNARREDYAAPDDAMSAVSSDTASAAPSGTASSDSADPCAPTVSASDSAHSPLDRYFFSYVSGVLSGCAEKLGQAVYLTQLPDGPYMYGEMIEGEKEQFERAAESIKRNGADGLTERITAISFGRLSTKKDDSVDPSKREMAKGLRDAVKKIRDDLIEQFFTVPVSVTMKRNEACKKNVAELIDLVLAFDRRKAEKKREKKLIDFTDMEHFALNILLKREGDTYVPTQIARQYREYFQEILIDEYQDSNLVQEYFLKAVSGEEDGKYNRFMVGDVKQSIYRFRLARPELFLEKYKSYGREESPDTVGPESTTTAGCTGSEPGSASEASKCNKVRIDLSKNFRSRSEVTETVNRVFEHTMSEQVGGIAYDDAAALHAGASYPECEIGGSELILVEKPEKGDEIGQKEAEAFAIADKIIELRKNAKVRDNHTGEMRPVEFRDIVILLRTLTGWGDSFKSALDLRGIPAYVTSKSGYFTATEVQDVLNFLRVIDNPLQDIPLYGVLRSFFGGFSEEEIAALRAGAKDLPLYETLLSSEDPKVTSFLAHIAKLREKTVYLTIRTLLEQIFREYDYLNYVTALPGGGKRRANLEMLLVKASDFERTSYFGLFHFLRYMDMLEKYDEDYGEADTLDENADVVRIMSIHKSKGLEFPVTIVAGLTKSFNMQDVNKAVIMDSDLGIGIDFVDPEKRLKSKTFRKNVIAKKLREDTLAEELRLLYVAMTRPKEKLILTALVQNPDAVLESAALSDREGVRLTYLEFMKATSFLDFLLPILKKTGLSVSVTMLDSLRGSYVKEQIDQERAICALKKAQELTQESELSKLKDRLNFRYPHAALEKLYVKTTVSELKIAAMSEKDEAAFHAFEDRETESYIPEFRRGEQAISGTVRGDAYHRVMELLDYEKILGDQFETLPADYETYQSLLSKAALRTSIDAFLQEKVAQSVLSEEYKNAIRTDRISAFVESSVGYRAWRAQSSGKLYREQPFFLTIPATRLDPAFPADETVLIQGIIDLYLVEDDGIVLLDYKTDRVDSLDALWNRYELQLTYYTEALERLTGLPVKQKILYSFHLSAF